MKKLLFFALTFTLLINIAAVSAYNGISNSNSQNSYFNQVSYGQNTMRLSETWKIKDKLKSNKREITITHTMDVPQYAFFSENSGSSDFSDYQFPGNSNSYYPTYQNNYQNQMPRFTPPNYFNNNNNMAQNMLNYANSPYGSNYNNYYPQNSYPRFSNQYY